MAELERKRIDRESHRGTGVGLWSLWLETTAAAATVAWDFGAHSLELRRGMRNLEMKEERDKRGENLRKERENSVLND